MNTTLGQPLLLPCETGVSRPPNTARWIKDGQQLISTEVRLPLLLWMWLVQNSYYYSRSAVLLYANFMCTQNEVILSNGTLLILGASAGIYQCTGYYNDEPLNSTTYHVSITQVAVGRS